MRTALGPRSFFSRRTFPEGPSGWSSDGSLLIYDITDPQTGGDIWALPLVGKAEPYPVVRTAADEHYGTLSPDGRWLAYISNETGAYEVYAESFPATGFKRQFRRRAASSRSGDVTVKSCFISRPIRR